VGYHARVRSAPDLRLLLFSPRGRVDRGTWWRWGVFAVAGLHLYFTAILRIAGMPAANTDVLVSLLLLWPALALSVKRWHDLGYSGWWVLVALIPVLGWLWIFVANGLLPGMQGPNRFDLGCPAAARQ
jgi:uncharacterized membrane protein YhaH (DUF805 family)